MDARDDLSRVTVVTVTYGSRTAFLIPVLDAARAQGVGEAVVVNNGSAADIGALLGARFGDWAVVLDMGCNTGSAPGFRAGIERALERGAEFLLLLDDDNVVESGCIAKLRDVFAEKSAVFGPGSLALSAFRYHHHSKILVRQASRAGWRTSSTFLGFHVLNVPRQIVTRVFRPVGVSQLILEAVATEWGPYGGLFFHRSLVEEIGLPNQAFVLYADDVEFTHRLFKRGGGLFIVPDAKIVDTEASWTDSDRRRTAFSTWLEGESDIRAFYSFRNGTYWDFHCRNQRLWVLLINVVVYLTILTGVAVVKGRIRRLVLLVRALFLGLRGHLGVSPAFPL